MEVGAFQGGLSYYCLTRSNLWESPRQSRGFTCDNYAHAVNATLSKFIGTHTLKFGGSFRRIGVETLDLFFGAGSFDFSQDFTQGPDPLGPDRGTGDALASLLLGVPDRGFIEVPTANDFFVNYFAGFVQDDWRVSSNVVLNLGLRVEYETGLQEKNNAFTVGFDRETPWPVQPVEGMTLRGGLMYAGVGGNPTQQGDPTAVKLGPRAGVSWSLDDRTVIRGGYGLFWSPPQMGFPSTSNYGTIGYTGRTNYLASAGRRLDASGHHHRSLPARCRTAHRERSRAPHQCWKRRQLRRSVREVGLRAAVLDWCAERASVAIGGDGELFGNPR